MEAKPNKNIPSSSSKTGNGSNNEPTKDLRSLFKNILKDIYWVEKTLSTELPRMIKRSTSEELISVLTMQLRQSEDHARKLEEVFAQIRAKNETKTCEALKGLIRETEELMTETTKGEVCDAGIITSAQKIAHYEIASYGTLCAFAKVLGEERSVQLLQQNLAEEKDINVNFTKIAEDSINFRALHTNGNR